MFLDESTLQSYLPDGAISSLRRIEALYGALAEAREASDRGGEPGKFGLYLTPSELDEFVSSGEEDRVLVTVRVDLTEDSPVLENVDIEPLREDYVPKLGFSRYPWGRGIDNSITRRGAKGGSDAGTAQRYCLECLQRWTNGTEKEPAVGALADEHPDGWVIDGLRELGLQEDTDERLGELIDPKFPTDSPRVVATVAVRLPEERLDHPPDGDPDAEGYYYPGQLHVLNAGMRARKEEKLARKNLPDSADPSRGDAACMVTGEKTRVFGTTEDPLAFFTVQHAEKFPRLSKSNSWRTHPVSSEAALLMQSGASLLEGCSDTRNGLRVYTIPYFREMNTQRAELLYEAVRGDSVSMSQVYEDITEGDVGEFVSEELRFYVIGVRDDSGDINVLFEVPNADIYWPTVVAKAHGAVLDVKRSTTFSLVAGLAPDENWYGLSPSADQNQYVESITDGLYAFGTMPDPGTDSPTTDDPREWLTQSLLTGTPVDVDRLLAAFVDRLVQERRDEQPIGRHVKTQYAQFEALSRAGLLEAPADRPEFDHATVPMTNHETTTEETAADGGVLTPESVEPTDIAPDGDPSATQIRKFRLKNFLRDRATLQNNPERRGAFLIGVLVGQLSDHQSTAESNGGRGMNRTIRDRHPPEQLTADRIERLYTGDLERLPRVYGRDRGTGPLFPETRNLLRDTLADAKPDDWELPVHDLRFFYALGVEFGESAGYQAYELAQQLDIETNDAPEEEPA
ncbi:type I-B CRISPR-associated protein Cas8b/Csh1 [Halobaculum gomorrense]|uniref:CRISPR-associated protein, Csh1 family n=1 Tax=Halobaculum gomorrense TaxID=43928 RepID=A0A1M5URZ8_9EURY|nr:type I-B CRISPR-associated protein Cas8b/Csh1 [Halobaculum gomorrense]SHH65704.1 CRISPR-associated protein, Csh1 family [Halobaculum gomorrense]